MVAGRCRAPRSRWARCRTDAGGTGAAILLHFGDQTNSPGGFAGRQATLTYDGGPATFAGKTAMKPPAQPVNPAPRIRRWPIRLAAVVICLAILAAYHNSFLGPFVFDDEPAVLDNPTIRQLWPISQPLSPPADLTVSGRPLANLTLAINYALSGTQIWSYHPFNLLVHVLAALTLFGVVRRTLACARGRRLLAGNENPRKSTPSPPSKRGSTPVPASAAGPRADDPTFIALAITLLWALHPLQTEAVTYVVQRVESLMGLFFLLTLYCFIRSVEAPRPRPWQGCAIIACLLGAATKEVIALAPVLVLLYDRTFIAGSFAAAWRQRWRIHLALAFTWVVLAGLVASTGWNRNGTSGFDIGVPPSAYWLTQFEAVARYLWLSIWPHPLVFEYGTIWVNRAAEVLPYAVLVVPLAVATLVALWRWPVAGFLGAWFFGILAPTSIMPGRIQMIVEHRMYLPLAAILVLTSVGLYKLLPRAFLPAGLVVASLLGLLTGLRNHDYRSELAIWEDTVVKRPEGARAQGDLANVLATVPGRLPEALAHYEQALRIDPDFAEAHNNLANVLVTIPGRLPEALAHYEQALRINPDFAEAHNDLANVLATIPGRLPEALAHYEQALRIKPNYAAAHNNLGVFYCRQGRLEEAKEHWERALELDPHFEAARLNLGLLPELQGK